MKKILLLSVVSLVFVSCGYKKEAKEVTQDFFSAIKNDKEEKMKELYPEVGNLQNYYKSDTIIVNEVTELEEKKYSVSITNKFTNGLGKSTESQITIYTKPKNEEKPSDGYIIYDSKGLCDLSDELIYKFAKRKGYVKEDSITDQQIANSVKEASKELMRLTLKFNVYLIDNVKVTDWSWRTSDYSNSASGSGVVKNNTKYTIPNLKYIVTYSRNGNEIAQDDGSVSYDDLRPYGMKSFSFYTSYVGNANKASIRLDFDSEFMIETVANGDFDDAE